MIEPGMVELEPGGNVLVNGEHLAEVWLCGRPRRLRSAHGEIIGVRFGPDAPPHIHNAMLPGVNFGWKAMVVEDNGARGPRLCLVEIEGVIGHVYEPGPTGLRIEVRGSIMVDGSGSPEYRSDAREIRDAMNRLGGAIGEIGRLARPR